MLSENWLEEMLMAGEAAEAVIPEINQPTQEELVIREMLFWGEISQEEALVMLNKHKAS